MSDTSPPRRRRLNPLQLLLLLFALGVAVGASGEVFRLFGPDDGRLNDVFVAILVLVVLPTALLLTVLWWRRLDEAAREAHKWAWYWGASAGIVAAAPLLAAPEQLGVVGVAGRIGLSEPAELVSLGVVAVLLLQSAGYVIAWAVWWLRRR